MPLGVAIGALYAGIVLLAAASPRILDFRCSPPPAPPGCLSWGAAAGPRPTAFRCGSASLNAYPRSRRCLDLRRAAATTASSGDSTTPGQRRIGSTGRRPHQGTRRREPHPACRKSPTMSKRKVFSAPANTISPPAGRSCGTWPPGSSRSRKRNAGGSPGIFMMTSISGWPCWSFKPNRLEATFPPPAAPAAKNSARSRTD